MSKISPKFKPKPGQIDFTHARFAPVINCILEYRGKILLVQRNSKLNFYPNYWNGVSGFLDDKRGLEEKIKDELQEELGVVGRYIQKITLGQIFEQEAPKIGKTWIVHPVLVKVSLNKIKLDWEAKKYVWIKPKEARKFKLLPGFNKVIKSFFEVKL